MIAKKPTLDNFAYLIFETEFLTGLKNNKKVFYQQLLVENKLNDYLYDLDTYLKEYEERLINQIASNENITEELKSKDQLQWVRQMNNIKFRVQEIIMKEHIYV